MSFSKVPRLQEERQRPYTFLRLHPRLSRQIPPRTLPPVLLSGRLLALPFRPLALPYFRPLAPLSAFRLSVKLLGNHAANKAALVSSNAAVPA